MRPDQPVCAAAAARSDTTRDVWLSCSATCFSCIVWLKRCDPLRAAAAADAVSDPRPRDNMAVTSSMPTCCGRGLGAGVEPKPTYLPPWFGGKWSGRLAFCSILRAKNVSFCAAEFSSCERVYSLLEEKPPPPPPPSPPPLPLPPLSSPQSSPQSSSALAFDVFREEPMPTPALAPPPPRTGGGTADGGGGEKARPSTSARSMSRKISAALVLYLSFMSMYLSTP
mmetsp:Transcript_9445/g.28714  ORF Transcript_9445/g.28714 Transcript_9445/m.28714 type:complete len:225 (+) Transcript_9445:681-1355(+)